MDFGEHDFEWYIKAVQHENDVAAPTKRSVEAKIASLDERLESCTWLTPEQREAAQNTHSFLSRLQATMSEGDPKTNTIDQSKWDAFISSKEEGDVRTRRFLSTASRDETPHGTWKWSEPDAQSKTEAADQGGNLPTFPIQWFEVTMIKADSLIEATQRRRSERIKKQSEGAC